MWTSAVVEAQIPADGSAGLGHGFVGVEIDLLVFDRPPEPLDEHVVPPCALAVHRDGNLSLFQHGGEVDGGELRSLVGVEDVGLAVTGQRLLDRFDAEIGFHRDRQPPRQDLPAEPVRDGAEINEASRHGDVSQVHGPDLVGLVTASLRSR